MACHGSRTYQRYVRRSTLKKPHRKGPENQGSAYIRIYDEIVVECEVEDVYATAGVR